MHELLVVDVAERLAARVQRAVLGKGDHVVDLLPHLLALAERGGDGAMANALGGERAQERLTLVCRPAEAAPTHGVPLQVETRGY